MRPGRLMMPGCFFNAFVTGARLEKKGVPGRHVREHWDP